jgi:hypothetical protein
MRRLALTERSSSGQTSLWEKLLKIGAKVVGHGLCCVIWFGTA